MINKNNRICCVFNFGSHYRKSIYQLMDKELGCDFYLGDTLNEQIKQMDYNSLIGYKKSLKNITLFGNFFWQKGIFNVLFKPYKHYIIDGEPYNLSNWAILFFARVLRKRVYTWTHGWYGREFWLKIQIKKLFFGLAYHNFLYGNFARNLMIKEGFKGSKLSCIYNSLDYDNQLTLRNKAEATLIYRHHFQNNFYNLVFSGRLTNSKRLDLIFYALAGLQKRSIFINLTLIGPSDSKNDLYQLATNLGINDNIWFYGACYDELKLSELIFNADLCVSPGNVGLTAIHALMYGTPVLTHNCFINQGPEFEAIEDGVTGLFFDYNDVDSLSNSILRWIDYYAVDRQLIRQKCYEIIDKKYNPHYQLEVLKKVIQVN